MSYILLSDKLKNIFFNIISIIISIINLITKKMYCCSDE